MVLDNFPSLYKADLVMSVFADTAESVMDRREFEKRVQKVCEGNGNLSLSKAALGGGNNYIVSVTGC